MEKFLIVFFLFCCVLYNYTVQTYPLLQIQERNNILEVFDVERIVEVSQQQEQTNGCSMDSGPFCDSLTEKLLGRANQDQFYSNRQRKLQRSRQLKQISKTEIDPLSGVKTSMSGASQFKFTFTFHSYLHELERHNSTILGTSQHSAFFRGNKEVNFSISPFLMSIHDDPAHIKAYEDYQDKEQLEKELYPVPPFSFNQLQEITIEMDTPMLFHSIWLKMHEPDQFFQKESALLDADLKGYFQGQEVLSYEPILFNDAWKKFTAVLDLKIDKLVIPKNTDFDNLVLTTVKDFTQKTNKEEESEVKIVENYFVDPQRLGTMKKKRPVQQQQNKKGKTQEQKKKDQKKQEQKVKEPEKQKLNKKHEERKQKEQESKRKQELHQEFQKQLEVEKQEVEQVQQNQELTFQEFSKTIDIYREIKTVQTEQGFQILYADKKAHNEALVQTLIDWISLDYEEVTEEDKKNMKEKSQLILENHMNQNKENSKKKLRMQLKITIEQIISDRYTLLFSQESLKTKDFQKQLEKDISAIFQEAVLSKALY